MSRWLDLSETTLRWVGRAYGVMIFGIGALLLFWAGRGALAYSDGIRAAWTDPVACLAGFIGGVLGVWAGARVIARGIPPGTVGSRSGISAALESTLDQASKLERDDPVAAQRLLDSYFSREAAMKEARRAELRAQASYDVEAASALRRELGRELQLNALFRKDVLKKWPEDQRTAMLAEIDQTDTQVQAELLALEKTIERLRLR